MKTSPEPLQLWGGVECTINRVHDTFFDQLALAGHRQHLRSDLQQIAALGLKTLRVGLQWEHFVASGSSWADADALLACLDECNIRPIAGLLHHGSGPRGTSLLDPAFPEKLAAYALSVAQRYPSILDYTPVNEPQTTARFSCLYGHWYPHHRGMASYARCMVLEMKAIVLAMQAIRSVQPAARLIHTEDGGVTYATPETEPYRAEREIRRWLGVDLLCGLVDRHHPAFLFLTQHGIPAGDVLWFCEHPCPPSTLGLNYYVTSDRYLDHRREHYPSLYAGGDTGSEPLVDIEALRVLPGTNAGAAGILSDAWARYHLPLAITEAHLGGSPEDQVRWLVEVWNGALAAQARGADVRAVTVWALLGSWNWSNLCTVDAGVYEPGVFDVTARSPYLAPGRLAQTVHQLAHGLPPTDPALQQQGWWHSPDRLTYPAYEATADHVAAPVVAQP